MKKQFEFLSNEDNEALLVGRELMKNQENFEEPSLHKINEEYHKHLDSKPIPGWKRIVKRFVAMFSR